VIVTADHECSGASLIGSLKVNRDTVTKNLASDPGKATVLRDKQVGVYEGASFPRYRILADGYPADTDIQGKVLIGYGANADRYETWLSNPRPTSDSQQPFIGVEPLSTYPAHPAARNAENGLFIAGQVPGDNAVHTGTDVPLGAMGRGASLFSGFFDNTDVFFKIGQAMLGGVRE
jgi:alkaline phosphatase